MGNLLAALFMKIIIPIRIPLCLVTWFFNSESLRSISEYIWTHKDLGIILYTLSVLFWILKWILNMQNHSKNKLFLLFLAVTKVHLKVNASNCHRWTTNELAWRLYKYALCSLCLWISLVPLEFFALISWQPYIKTFFKIIEFQLFSLYVILFYSYFTGYKTKQITSTHFQVEKQRVTNLCKIFL